MIETIKDTLNSNESITDEVKENLFELIEISQNFGNKKGKHVFSKTSV